MDQLKHIQNSVSVKDNDKGHKIIAAVYLTTDHLTDSDPLKQALRTKCVSLITLEFETRKAVAMAIGTLLDAAVLARLISEKNASIINLEVRHYAALPTMNEQTVSTMFKNETQEPFAKLKRSIGHMSLNIPSHHKEKSPISKNGAIFENKNKRQDRILSFINDRKSAAIKDIATLFPDISEKTIQRELGTLVAMGKITKRGNKRWSLYMAVGA
jgi:hypothetical protein